MASFLAAMVSCNWLASASSRSKDCSSASMSKASSSYAGGSSAGALFVAVESSEWCCPTAGISSKFSKRMGWSGKLADVRLNTLVRGAVGVVMRVKPRVVAEASTDSMRRLTRCVTSVVLGREGSDGEAVDVSPDRATRSECERPRRSKAVMWRVSGATTNAPGIVKCSVHLRSSGDSLTVMLEDVGSIDWSTRTSKT